jgi:hypothetical protein
MQSDIEEHCPEKYFHFDFFVHPSRCESWKVTIIVEIFNVNNPMKFNLYILRIWHKASKNETRLSLGNNPYYLPC